MAHRARHTRARIGIELASWATVAAAIAMWALRDTDPAAVAAAAAGTDPAVLAAATAGFVVLFAMVDVTGFLLAYRRHVDPSVPWREVAVVVCGKQLIGLVNPLLTKAVAPAYFRRRRGRDPITAVGASEIVGLADATAVMLFVTLAAVGARIDLPRSVQVVVTLWWVAVAVQIVRRSTPRARTRAGAARSAGSGTPRPTGRLLAALNRAGPAEVATQVALRVVLGAGTLVFVRVVLGDLGPALDPAQLLTFGALLMFTTQLPLSIGGLGGPQGVAVLLLSRTWHVASDEQAAAFSLVWSALLLGGRFTLSAPLAPALVRLLRGPSPHIPGAGPPAPGTGHGLDRLAAEPA